jgi:hypothetical protein
MFKQAAIKHIGILLCICSIFPSCRKEEAPATDFTINGLHDVALEENGLSVLDIHLEPITANSEQVSLSVDGAPQGLNLTFNRITDKPPFTVKLYIRDDSAAAGAYPIALKAKSANGKVHIANFTVTAPEKTCAKKSSGLYHGTSFCRDGDGEIFGSINFLTDSANKRLLVFYWKNVVTYAVVDCNSSQLNIPLQSMGTYSIYGKGYIDQKNTVINFDYTELHRNGDSVKCNVHFIKL